MVLKRVYKIKNFKKQFCIFTALILTLSIFFIQTTSATVVTALSDTMTRLKVNTLSSHDILFTLSGSNTFAAGETVTIDFDEDGTEFTVAGAASVAGDFDFSTGATERVIYNVGSSTDCTGSVGVNDISVGINDTTGLVTFLACPSFTASAVGAIVNIEYGTAAGGTNRVTNPNPGTPPVTYIIDIAGTFGDDAGKIAAVIVADDQVVLNATVDPSITFSLSANSSNFGALSTGSIVQGATDITVTIGTNGSGGYTVYVRDSGSGANPGLYNSTASYTIGSSDASYADGPTNLSAGTEGYGICAASTTGSPTLAARFGNVGADCTASEIVGGLEITNITFISRATSMSSNDTAVVRHWAAIGSWTKAGSYTDTLTYTAAANF